MLELLCEICRAQLGQFDPEDVKLPLRGDMFKPRGKGYPEPFKDSAGFMELICIVCGKRAMNVENVLTTKNGPYEIGGEVPAEKATDHIGKAAESRQDEIDKHFDDDGCPGGEPEESEPEEPTEVKPNPLQCTKCGKILKTEIGRKRHERTCKA